MKKKSRKVSETPASHNGVYRLDELSGAFRIPPSVIYSWTVQKKLVTADYPGRSRRPSLYLEKSAAAIYTIKVMADAGISLADIKKFMDTYRYMVLASRLDTNEYAIIDKGAVKILVRIGVIRQLASAALRDYVEEQVRTYGEKKEKSNAKVQREPRSDRSAVQAHHGEPVDAQAGVASL